VRAIRGAGQLIDLIKRFIQFFESNFNITP
jgi:hypothetical protein